MPHLPDAVCKSPSFWVNPNKATALHNSFQCFPRLPNALGSLHRVLRSCPTAPCPSQHSLSLSGPKPMLSSSDMPFPLPESLLMQRESPVLLTQAALSLNSSNGRMQEHWWDAHLLILF